MNRMRNAAAMIGGLAGVAVASTALGQFVETEDNNTKATANVIAGLAPGGTITGTTTGSSTTVAGAASADNFDITTTAAPSAGIWRYRLVLTSATAGHACTIRGLSQTAGVPNAGTDVAVQTSSATTSPPRFVQWYANENPSRIIYRVTGSAATTAAYTVTLERAPVVPPTVGSSIGAGPVTINTVGQTSTDTDMWLYDASFVAIPGAGNDDESVIGGGTGLTLQSRLTRPLSPGTYYLALSNFNTSNNLGSPADDDFRTGNVMDFPNALANSSTTTFTNVNFQVLSVAGTNNVTHSKPGPFDVPIRELSVVAVFADECSGAIPVVEGIPAAISNNATALIGVSEVTCTTARKSVWYDFTAAAAGGTYVIDTEGTTGQPDTVLAVFSACGGTQLACDDDSGAGLLSRIQITLGASQNIRILVASFGSNPVGGLFNLNIAQTGACCSAMTGLCSITAGAARCTDGAFQGSGTVCTPSPCPDPSGSCCVGSCCSVTVQGACTGIWTVLGVCAPTNPCPAPANDNCAMAVALTEGVPAAGGNCNATLESGEAAPSCATHNRSVWYSFVPPATGSYNVTTCGTAFDTVLSVFEGGCGEAARAAVAASTTMGSGFTTLLVNTINGNGLTAPGDLSSTHAPTVPANSWVSAAGMLTGSVTFDLGGRVPINGFSFWNQNGGGPGASGITGIQGVTVLSATDGSNFIPIPGAPAVFAQQMANAPLPPEIFSFAPVSASHIRFTVGSNWGDVSQTGFAEVLFRQSQLQIACDDDACDGVNPPGSGLASRIAGVDLNAGTSYLIRVSSFGTAGGGPLIVSVNANTGACCRGSICVTGTVLTCTGVNSVFAGAGTTCNIFPASTTPCCLADFNHVGGLSVQDIFDFLEAYFGMSPLADINGSGLSVQDIFDFLTAYFGGGC